MDSSTNDKPQFANWQVNRVDLRGRTTAEISEENEELRDLSLRKSSFFIPQSSEPDDCFDSTSVIVSISVTLPHVEGTDRSDDKLGLVAQNSTEIGGYSNPISDSGSVIHGSCGFRN